MQTGKKILAIDDEFAALMKMKVLLSKFGQCDVATNGSQATEKISENIKKNKHYDLITIDIGLPDINGIDLLNQIQNLEKGHFKQSIKLMISASGTTENVIKALQNHCDGFLVKPVKRETLQNKLAEFGINPIAP